MHSQSPWVFNPSRTVLTSNNIKIFDVTTGVEPISHDARLISMAPQMLNCLEVYLDLFEQMKACPNELTEQDEKHRIIDSMNSLRREMIRVVAQARGAR